MAVNDACARWLWANLLDQGSLRERMANLMANLMVNLIAKSFANTAWPITFYYELF